MLRTLKSCAVGTSWLFFHACIFVCVYVCFLPVCMLYINTYVFKYVCTFVCASGYACECSWVYLLMHWSFMQICNWMLALYYSLPICTNLVILDTCTDTTWLGSTPSPASSAIIIGNPLLVFLCQFFSTFPSLMNWKWAVGATNYKHISITFLYFRRTLLRSYQY